MKRDNYGWVICMVATLTLFVTAGIANTGFAVYQPYLISIGGLSNTQSSVLITLRALFTFIGMIFTPVLLKKLEIKRMMCMALMLDCFAFAAFGLAQGRFTVYCAASSMAGSAHGFGGQIIAAVLIFRWFHEHRGLAVGICSAATGISAFIATPILTYAVERYSLKAAFFAESFFALLVMMLAMCLVYNNPEDKGVLPIGTKREAAVKIFEKNNPPQLLYLLIIFFLFLLGMASSNLVSHLSVLYQSTGFDSGSISLLVSAFGLALVIGKLSYGFTADKIGCFRAVWIWLACSLTGIALCCMAGNGNLQMAFMGVMLMGFGLAISTVALPMYASGISNGERCDASVMQFNMVFNLGALVFGVVPGMIADRMGTYVFAYFVMFILVAASVIGIQFTYWFIVKRKPRNMF